MKKKRAGLTLGSILTLCLTLAVTLGCIWAFGIIRAGRPDAAMDAGQIADFIGNALQGNGQSTQADTRVGTVMVTLPPAVATPTAAPMLTPAPGAEKQQYSFSLTIGGLMSFQSEISDTVYNKQEKTFDFRPVVADLPGKVWADMNLVMLPQTLNSADRKYDDYMAPAAAADAVRTAGFNDVLLGSEHILDRGAAGAEETVGALTGRGISCGGVTLGEARQNRIVQLNGARIAILSYTESVTAKGRNALGAQPELMRLYDEDVVRQDILNARAQGVHCVIVCMYWGTEDQTSVRNDQKKTARTLAEMGADVILGFRPAAVLPIEFISVTGENGARRQALVAYSMGTLLSESRDAGAIAGMLLHLNVTVNGAGDVRFTGVEYTPTYVWRQSVNGALQYRLVCSSDPAPEGMDQKQSGVMSRALTRIREAMKGCPAEERK